jgi:mannan endo-1,4-beta-mannosidase
MKTHVPANPDADDSARDLMQKLYRLKGDVVLSAQHDYISSGTRYREEIEQLVGRPPSIFGSDLSFMYRGDRPARLQHCGPANLTEPGEGVPQWDYEPAKVFEPETEPAFRAIDLHSERLALVQRCIDLHRAGAIITLMWHGPLPTCGDESGDNDLWMPGGMTADRWHALVDPQSELHRDWQHQVDHIAGYLKLLRDADVPVLWRPYHEMNGGWFWWGNQPNREYGFPRLWRMLFERLNGEHQLHNLLWVWNPNAPRDTPGDEAGAYEDYYPGHDMVDVLAADVYHDDYRQSHHDHLQKLAEGRPIALGEVGHLPSADVLQSQPGWSWVMPWGGLLFRFNTRENIRAIYSLLDRIPAEVK